MRPIVLCTLLLVLSRVHGETPLREKAAVDLLQRAVAAQGKLPPDGLQDLHIVFEGMIHDEKQGSHSVVRNYWFRSKDRSFRIQTYPSAKRDNISERGVLGNGKPLYWELIKRKRRKLKGTNKTHLENIRAIQRDRADFERILRMVVLSRVDRNLARIQRGTPRTVKLTDDAPNSAKYVFPPRLKESEYAVLDLQRDGGDPLRLFVNEQDLSVRKVVQFDRNETDKVKFVYYLGAYRKNQGLLMPNYVSVHTEVPTEDTREKTTKLAGRLSVTINEGLADSVFAPE